MTALLALSGWVVAGCLAAVGGRGWRGGCAWWATPHTSCAGAGTTLALASASMRREQGGLRRARAFESELDRLCAGLDDLDGARRARAPRSAARSCPLERALRTAAAGWRPVTSGQGRRLSLHWEAGTAAVRADRRRLAQVLGNLLANAVEHGSGAVRLRGRRRGSKVLIEVVDDGPRPRSRSPSHPDRGRGPAASPPARPRRPAGG